MNSIISIVGGSKRAIEIVDYHHRYFKNFYFYDVRRKVFSKKVDEKRNHDFIPVQYIESELKASSSI
jgi:hypothetical protein